ncbi:MAG TPA: hypothetical protein VGB20_04455 [bacterium]
MSFVIMGGRSRWHRAGAGIVVLAGVGAAFAAPAPASAAGCAIVIEATGRYDATLTERPHALPQLDFRLIGDPRFQITTRRNPRACERHAAADAGFSYSADNVDARYFHLLNEAKRIADIEGPGSQDPQGFADLHTALHQASLTIVGGEALSIAVDTFYSVLGRLMPVDVPAKLLINATKELLKAHLAGGDISGLSKAAIKEMLGLAQTIGVEDEILNLAVDAIKEGAAGLEAVLKDTFKTQSMTGTASDDDCEWLFYSFWNARTGQYRIRLQKTCGEVRAIDRASFAAPDANPGDGVAAAVGATDALGNPIQLRSVTVTGLEAVMAAGDRYAVNGVPGFAPTVTFTVAKPRRDRGFPLQVTLTDMRGATHVLRPTFTVLNVGPEVTGLDPSSVSADPDATMELAGAALTVVDDNADDQNPREITDRRIRLDGHPEGLKTQRRFDRFDTATQQSFDGASGTYTFLLTRSGGKVERPHEHETYSTSVTVQDDNGQAADDALTLEVNDVAPEIVRMRVEPQFVHSGDGKTIAISGRFEDGNGWEDIEAAFADATAAGGGKFVLDDLLRRVRQDEDFIEVEADPFAHTDAPGRHDIPVEVSDGKPNTATSTEWIHVGNLAPEIATWGYIYEANEPVNGHRHVCPNQEILVGAMVGDPEGDPVVVTATIVETGQQIELKREPGAATYTGVLIAPGAPGEYTIRFDAKETVYDEQAAPFRTSPLTVDPCGAAIEGCAAPPVPVTGEQLIYQTIERRGVTAQVAAVLKQEGARSMLEVSVLTTGRGTAFRTWVPEKLGLALSGEKRAPAGTERYYVTRESIAAGAAPAIFAAIAAHHVEDAERAAGTPGEVCHGGGAAAGHEARPGAFKDAIEQTGRAAGMALLTSAAQGEIVGLRGTFDVTCRTGQLAGAVLNIVANNEDPARGPLARGPTQTRFEVPLSFETP